MAISQVTKGVFVVSPEPSKRWEDTMAGQYARIFTKARQEQWELSQKQALMEYKSGADRYEEEMKAYRERAKALNDQAKANQAALVQVQNGALKAGDAAKLAAVKAGLDIGKTEAGLAAKAVEQTPVSQGSKSSSASTSASTGTGGGGFGGGASGRVASEDDSQIQAAKSKAGTDPVALANEVDTRVGVGKLSQTDAARADRTRYGTVRESVEAKKSAYINQNGMTAEDAEIVAEDDTLNELRSGGRADFAEAYGRQKAKLPPPVAGGGGTRTSESQSRSQSINYGSRLQTKYPGLSTQFPLLTPDEQANILAQLEPEDRQGLIEDLKLRQGKLEGDLTALDRPEFTAPDFITRSREIAAGRFGPTPVSPAFQQRNAMQGILGLSPEDQQALLAKYRASRPVPVTAPAPALTAAPLPQGGTAPPAPVPSVEPVRVPGMYGSLEDYKAAKESSAQLASAIANVNLQPPAGGLTPTARFLMERQARGFGEQDTEDISTLALRIGRPVEAYAPEELGPKPEGVLNLPSIQYGRPRAQEFGILGMDEATARQLSQTGSPALAAVQLPPPLGVELRAPAVNSFMPPRPVMQPPVIEAAPIASPVTRMSAPPPPSIGTYTPGEIPAPIAVTGPSAAAAAPTAPMQGTPGFRTPLQGQSPESITAGTNIAIRRAQASEAEAKKKADEAVVGKAGILGATPPKAYYAERVSSAMVLKDQPDKMKRLVASGPGRVGYQIYAANKAKGIPFSTTYDEIVNTFAGDKEAMKKAHDVAMASAFAAHDSVNPKE
jgi:hypothetical protein